MKPCWFHPEALAEADDTAAFYKEQQPGLEARFLEALNDAVARIRRNPLMYPRIEGEIRKCRVMRFPYGVIYRVGNDQMEIIAIMHLRRRPGYWKSRF
jgi:plasmid stabilization system protein ParE